MAKTKKKLRGVESLKSRYGLMFVTMWIIGVIIFFLKPLCESLFYSFSTVDLAAEGSVAQFTGITNYKQILLEDPDYLKNLQAALGSIVYSLPLILIVSLVLALILNQNFKGRIFFRGLYFLPVIIATGVVMQYIGGQISSDQISSSVTDNMFSVTDIMNVLSLPASIATPVQSIISNIFSLVWKCGIQIVLFIAGLQSIPSTLYEASKVEGASKWEDFWFITFPSLSRVTLLVTVFTMIELFTDANLNVIKIAFGRMKVGVYDISSAMLWFYFLVVGAVLGLVLFLYNKLLMKRWE